MLLLDHGVPYHSTDLRMECIGEWGAELLEVILSTGYNLFYFIGSLTSTIIVIHYSHVALLMYKQ
jgi:hypothetical protein